MVGVGFSPTMSMVIGAEHQREAEAGSYLAIRRSMLGLVTELQALDIRAYEALELDDQVRRIHPIATLLLARGGALVQEVMSSCETTTTDTLPPGLPFELTMDAAVRRDEPSAQDACDIAFCAHLELRQRQQRLAEVEGSKDSTTLLGECDSALRRLYKALCAIEVALARAAHEDPLLDFTPELERSLRVRRYYARFGTKILSGPEPTARTLVARLRAVGTAIAMLVGQEVYAELRVGDRLQLRSLQRRLLHWLRSHSEGDSPESGLDLWSDIKAFVGMLSQVNRRQELVEHDASVLRDAARYAHCATEDTFPPELQCRMELLSGLDSEVDRLLGSADGTRIAAWLPVFHSLGCDIGEHAIAP